jgi:hypothetical protein
MLIALAKRSAVRPTPPHTTLRAIRYRAVLRGWALRPYLEIEDIEACETAGMVPYVPRPQLGPSVKADLYRKDKVQYGADSDSYVCPPASVFIHIHRRFCAGLKKINYTNSWYATIAQPFAMHQRSVSHDISP